MKLKRGIVDASRLVRTDRNSPVYRAALAAGLEDSCYGAEMAVTAFTAFASTNVTVEGVTFRDPPRWTMIVRAQSKNVTIDNVKLVGLWRYNSDGIDIVASEDVTIRNSFVRSYDDCIVARGAYLVGDSGPLRHMKVENCVLWCDWGKNLEVWAGGRPCVIEDVAFRRCALVNVSCIACDVTTWFGSSATLVRDIAFEDIEVDVVRPKLCQQMQTRREDRFVPRECPDMAVVVVDCMKLGKDLGNQQFGAVGADSDYCLDYENLRFANFRFLGDTLKTTALIAAEKPGHAIRNVIWQDMPAELEVTKTGKVTGFTRRVTPHP